MHKTVKLFNLSISDTALSLGYCSYLGIQQQLRICWNLHMTSWLAAGCPSIPFNQANAQYSLPVQCPTVASLSKPVLTLFTHNRVTVSLARSCGNVEGMDLGGQGEASGINKDKTESILTTVEAFQPTLARCLPQPPCINRTDTGGGHAVLSMQHPAAAPTQGNALQEVRCKCCFLATGQPRKKSGLPPCMGPSSKQLAQKFMWTLAAWH